MFALVIKIEMKNIHILKTDKPSKLHLGNSSLVLCDLNYSSNTINSQHIYITNDEEIKEGDWCIDNRNTLNKIINVSTNGYLMFENGNSIKDINCKKIILTTDQDLIKDGVQEIDDELLEWFVKNPSCEYVEVDKVDIEQPKPLYPNGNHKGERVWIETYKIIIPKEESKQERMYSEEEFKEKTLLAMINIMQEYSIINESSVVQFHEEWFEQNKTK